MEVALLKILEIQTSAYVEVTRKLYEDGSKIYILKCTLDQFFNVHNRIFCSN